MALTKEDLKEIKKITDTAVDNLALITKRGFDDVDERFAKVEGILNKHTEILGEHSKVLSEHGKILSEHSSRFNNHDARLSNIESDLDYLKTGHQELFLQVQGIDDKLAFMSDRLKKLEKYVKTMNKRLDALEIGQDNLMSEIKFIRRQLSKTINEEQYEIVEKRIFRLEQAVGLAT